jgi:hypothetical protein
MPSPIPLSQRRRLPPLLRELLRLCCPRELAACVDFLLEYPEKASELVPLRGLVAF